MNMNIIDSSKQPPKNPPRPCLSTITTPPYHINKRGVKSEKELLAEDFLNPNI